MDSTIRDFFSALNKQEVGISAQVKDDNIGLLIRSAITELDWYSYNYHIQSECTDEQAEQLYILRLGVLRLTHLALDSHESFAAPAFMYIRNKDNASKVLEVASALGFLQHGRRVAQAAANGVCTITKNNDHDFSITLPGQIPDPEFYETQLSDHYKQEYEKFIKASEFHQKKIKNEDDVKRLATDLVFPFMRHWIGYGADPLLDDYFFCEAYKIIITADGADSFRAETKFNDIPFYHYKLSLAYILSLHLKHIYFANALIDKEPNVRLENILTITSEAASFIQSIADAVNLFGLAYDNFMPLSNVKAAEVFRILSVGKDSPADLWRPGACIPPLIRTSPSALLRCISSLYDNPVQFMLNSLRAHFPREYDTRQRERESGLCNSITQILANWKSELEFRRNIKIKVSGRIATDIDLAIFEPSTNTLVLCQLKHQELYGSDLHAKYLRSARLNDQISKWLECVDQWISKVGINGIKSSIRINPKNDMPNIYKVAITRHYAHPLNKLDLNNDTAFGNYLQLYNSVNILKVSDTPNAKLSDLITLLRTSQAPHGEKYHRSEPDISWCINELTFSIRSGEPNSKFSN